MLFYKEYKKHPFNILGKKIKYDTNIYTFDIETTSYLLIDGKILPAVDYEKLSKKKQAKARKQSTMYIWQFSINDVVYYGRTWDEFLEFINIVFDGTEEFKKIIFIHNLSFEFEYLKMFI